MRTLVLHFIWIIALGFISCIKPQKFTADRKFLNEIDYYIKYIDSTGDYKNNFDFIDILAKKKHDTVDFTVTLYGGSYIFLHRQYSVKDFLTYKGYSIVLRGDFPNSIVSMETDKHLDIVNDIVKKYYKEDFKKFKKDSLSVGPLIYDYMGLFLTYRQDSLIKKKEEYY